MQDRYIVILQKMVVCAIFLLYPFLPLLKEWSTVIGSVLESTLLVLLALSAITDIDAGQVVFVYGKSTTCFTIFIIIYFVINLQNIYVSFSGLRVFLLYIFVYSILNNREKNRTQFIFAAARTNTIISIIMSMGCIVQFVFPSLIRLLHSPSVWTNLRSKTDWVPFSIYNRALSLMTDPNVLSVYLVFSLLITFIILKKHSSYKLCILIQLVGIILTQSRTGIFLVLFFLIFKLIFELFRTQKFSIKKFITIFFFVIVGVIFVLIYWDVIKFYLRFNTLLSGNGRFAKSEFQLSHYFSGSLKFIMGNGLFDGREIIFENTYIMLFYMFGLIGTLFFILFSYFTFRSCFSKYNIEILLCYAAACYVGDYILIPQVSIVVILCLLLYRYIRKSGSLRFVMSTTI